MNFGVPKEVRDQENRVGLTPAGVHALVEQGHQVYIERGAGMGAGFTDENYRALGAEIVYSADEAYGRADLLAKVTRLTAGEHALLRPGQTVLSFSHLAVASPDLVEALQQRSITAIAYEMIQSDDGTLPVLTTSSEVAGRLAPVIAGEFLASTRGGRGILLSGVLGVPPAAVVILGAGALGTSAARAFLGLGAQVTVLDHAAARLQRMEELFAGRVITLFSTAYNLRRVLEFADVLVGAVLMPGQRAPVVITRDMVKRMRARSLIIDFSIDQGGCVETSRPTTHRNPTFVEEGVVHYCVPTILSLVARTASHALLNGALPYLAEIGSLGVDEAIKRDPTLARGVNLWHGQVVNAQLAEALGVPVQAMPA
ncbi:MAG: alanine dehydrogenase [Chloroflexi bacterium]|nr:alanine dehydrogenase [Chloroflexota bacterium]